MADEAPRRERIELTLEDARPPAAAKPAAAPTTRPLGEAAATRLFDKLPVLPRPAAVTARLPRAVTPPPRAGERRTSLLPPATTPAPARPVAALRIELATPQGEIERAANLSVTFSQPMVALGESTGDGLATERVPVRLSPQPPGKWRWIGTRTLLFEPEGGFPQATSYEAEIPAGVWGQRSEATGAPMGPATGLPRRRNPTGTASAGGATLATAYRFQFATPPPKLRASHPSGGAQSRQPVLFARFDQRVDPAAVLAATSLVAAKAGALPALRAATAEEVTADATVAALAKQAAAGTFVVLRPEAPLPADTKVVVRFASGLRSAEGPRPTSAVQEFSFQTHGPLRIVRVSCGWDEGVHCPPGTPWRIELTNPLDEEVFTAEQVRIEPAVSEPRIEVYGNSIQIRAPRARRGSYRLALSPGVRDVFGQTLGEGEAGGTVQVTPAPPWIGLAGGELAVIEAKGDARLRVYSTNVAEARVEVRRVTPDDWPAWQARRHARDGQGRALPGRVVLTRTLQPVGAPDESTETAVDLAAALGSGPGQFVVAVEWIRAQEGAAAETRDPTARRAAQWLQVTRLGLETLAGPDAVLTWVSALADGAPIAGATVALVHPERAGATAAVSTGRDPEAMTGADGLATLALASDTRTLLVIRHADDVALLPANRWGGGWTRRAPASPLRAYVFDDRGLYRPGETARVKGYLRRVGGGPRGDVDAADVRSVDWTLHDARGRELAKGTATTGGAGAFDLTLALPEDAATGSARLSLQAAGQEVGDHELHVQEFRRPEFEVSIEKDAPEAVVGEPITLSVHAAYFSGGGLGAAPARWAVSREPATFDPPGLDDFVFGAAPSWFDQDNEDDADDRSWEFAGLTDVEGRHGLRLTPTRLEPEQPVRLQVAVSVEDVNRQAWNATAGFVVHPARVAVGLRLSRAFVREGESLELEGLVADLGGEPVAGRSVDVRAERLEWKREKGRTSRQPIETRQCTWVSTRKAEGCRFDGVAAGSWRITARTTDEQQRATVTVRETWVAGGRREAGPLDTQEAKVVADRKEYAPGDVAELLVLAPFFPAHGLLTLQREGLAETVPFRVVGPTTVVRARIEAAFMPGIEAAVTLVGRGPHPDQRGGEATGSPRAPSDFPLRATGETTLAVSTAARRLTVQARPAEAETTPGAPTSIALELKDAQGRPVAGEITLAVVDDAVVTLGGSQRPDPLGAFHPKRWGGITATDSRSLVVVGSERPTDDGGGDKVFASSVGAPQAMPAARMMKMEESGPAAPIALRSDFAPMALFAAAVKTDAAGTAQVPFKLPDSVTRWRVIAVAAAGVNQFGTGEASLVARLPLAVRPSPPRFLNLGDRFLLPVVVQNQTDAPADSQVAVRAANLDLGSGVAGASVTVPARDRVEVRFPAQALALGEAILQAAAAADVGADAAQLSLPVSTPASAEAFATYGVVERGAVAEAVHPPANALPGLGGLEVSLSTTALSSLAEAVLYLDAYPFECAEQVSSRLLGLVAMRDVLPALGARDLPSRAKTDRALGKAITRLVSMQNDDGGFAFWVRGRESWPWLSAHAAHALVRARSAGLDVPVSALEGAKRYLRSLEGRPAADGSGGGAPSGSGDGIHSRRQPADGGLGAEPRLYRGVSPQGTGAGFTPALEPDGYDAVAWRAVRAYALHVRGLLGDRDARALRALSTAAAAQGPAEALGLLLPLLAEDSGASVERDAVLQALANRATQTASTATVTESYSEAGPLVLHSTRRTDAIALDGLLAADPKHALVEKLVAGLQAARVAGRWATTQENAFVLLALARCFRAFESAAPNFTAAAWLGAASIGEAAFRGREAAAQQWSVPMEALQAAGAGDLVLAKEGVGRLHYRIGLRYVPASLALPPVEAGFTVVRRYEAVDDAADVRRDEGGTWHVRAGARVRVKLDLVAPARRHHVALVDPLPAGFEPLNPDLPATGAPGEEERWPVAGSAWRWWVPRWYEHQNLRDDRAEAFATSLAGGVYEYTYVTRATTAGTFLAPNPRAEEMYAPETFGRGAADRVVIE